MMLALDEVDGLVSGAGHTTANTIRPTLQLIRTAPGVTTVSSVFFMLMPNEVLVYGDCAVNPDPTAEELADIDSARAFGVDPRVAMISYSTGTSGSGVNVDKVVRALTIARAKRPDLLIDGPLQYDAASVESVGRLKAPDRALSHQPFLLISTYRFAGAGFNKVNGLGIRSSTVSAPILARCDNASGGHTIGYTMGQTPVRSCFFGSDGRAKLRLIYSSKKKGPAWGLFHVPSPRTKAAIRPGGEQRAR